MGLLVTDSLYNLTISRKGNAAISNRRSQHLILSNLGIGHFPFDYISITSLVIKGRTKPNCDFKSRG